MNPLNRRFHSKHDTPLGYRVRTITASVLCTILFAGAGIGIWQVQEHNCSDINNTAVLSFPASAQLMEQFDTKISMRILELFPAEKTLAQQEETIMLYPGGQPIGILLRTDGILVVGYSSIQTDSEELQPAEDAGVQAGDIIVSVNGTAVSHDDQLALLVNQLGAQGEDITLQIERQNRSLSKTIEPVYCQETDTYRIGLLIRDNAGGVGTLTFVDPATMQYGALGHMIANSETQRKLSIINGKLVAADIQGIKKGISGVPGEKIGHFVSNDPLGTIEKNTAAGIFGTLSERNILSETVDTAPIPIAAPKDIMTGPAAIYTALDGKEVECYTIEIEKISSSGRDGKDLIIKVTDPKLLQRTGGIVQGMSGSPIIQNGKFVGAVTHVFINDPTRGYGILIGNMLKELS